MLSDVDDAICPPPLRARPVYNWLRREELGHECCFAIDSEFEAAALSPSLLVFHFPPSLSSRLSLRSPNFGGAHGALTDSTISFR